MAELTEKDFPSLGKPINPSFAVNPEDWELLNTAEEEEAIVLLVDENSNKEHHGSVVNNRKVLFHCASSPDLRKIHSSSIDEDDGYEKIDLSENDTSSYSFISRHGSSSVSSSLTPGFSFRDAIMKKTEDTQEDTVKALVSPIRRKTKPKIVVQPIQRCAKSMVDLRSLDRVTEEENEDILGETDASCFYSQKAMGAAGRRNGLKLRPDEASRKAMILNKKKEQRAKQGAKK